MTRPPALAVAASASRERPGQPRPNRRIALALWSALPGPPRFHPRPERTMPDSDLISQLTAFVSVVLIDVVLAGDNAVVVGTAAAGLPPEQQRRVIMVGSAL